jgi:hypothetical protein
MVRESRVRFGILAALPTKVGLSLFLAGGFYLAWMGIFILSANSAGRLLQTVLWGSAPIATALGFALGVAVFERLTKEDTAKFSNIVAWPLLGCVIGAASVYWLGPMLIVFGMFTLGTLSVILREVSLRFNKPRHDRDA